MAIIKDLEVCVHADGEPLEERQDTSIREDDDSKLVRYVEATTGQCFEIHMTVPPEDLFEGDLLSYDIEVDGRLVDNPLVQKGCSAWLPVEVSYGQEQADGTVRRFCFSGLVIEEYNAALRARDGGTRDPNRHRDVGKIVIKVYHKNLGVEGTRYVDPNGWKEIDKVDEKTIKGKAVSHSVGLTPPVELGGSSVYHQTSFVDPDRVPVAVFTFLYRSAEKLNSILIATPTASPEPEPDLEDLNPVIVNVDQVAALQRRVKALEKLAATNIRGVKREYDEDANDDGPMRRARRPRSVTYLELRDGDGDGDDAGFEEVEAPVRARQPSTQVD